MLTLTNRILELFWSGGILDIIQISRFLTWVSMSRISCWYAPVQSISWTKRSVCFFNANDQHPSRPPDASKLQFTATLQNGTALQTFFTLNCSGGYSPLQPLKYSIGYTTQQVSPSQSTTTLVSNCFWITRKAVECSTRNITSLTLPVRWSVEFN